MNTQHVSVRRGGILELASLERQFRARRLSSKRDKDELERVLELLRRRVDARELELAQSRH
jgi:hypothetical protein